MQSLSMFRTVSLHPVTRRHGRPIRHFTRSTTSDKSIPSPYELYDETIKKISQPAVGPVMDELEKTNKTLTEILDILVQFKARKLDGLVPADQLPRRTLEERE